MLENRANLVAAVCAFVLACALLLMVAFAPGVIERVGSDARYLLGIPCC